MPDRRAERTASDSRTQAHPQYGPLLVRVLLSRRWRGQHGAFDGQEALIDLPESQFNGSQASVEGGAILSQVGA